MKDLPSAEPEWNNHIEKPQTYGDIIRAMTDYELADWLIHLTEDDTPNWHKWVKQEAENEWPYY